MINRQTEAKDFTDKQILDLISEQYGIDKNALRDFRRDLMFLSDFRKLCDRSKIIAFTLLFTIICTVLISALWHGLLNSVGIHYENTAHSRDKGGE